MAFSSGDNIFDIFDMMFRKWNNRVIKMVVKEMGYVTLETHRKRAQTHPLLCNLSALQSRTDILAR